MQRVLVMGSSGSGKSTFARRLSDMTGLPFVSLDALFWKPGWVESDKIDFKFLHYVWTYRQQQRPKLLNYFEGLRADQSLVCFTDRAQANDYLKAIALRQNRASIH
jgi:hypothetical protein